MCLHICVCACVCVGGLTPVLLARRDLQDKYMRTLAEMENLRRRHATEIKNSKDFGIQSFSKDLVTVADVLEMAVENAPKEVSR